MSGGAERALRSLRFALSLGLRADPARFATVVVATTSELLAGPLTAWALGRLLEGILAGDRDAATGWVIAIAGLTLLSYVVGALVLPSRMRLRAGAGAVLDRDIIGLTERPNVLLQESPAWADGIERLRAERPRLSSITDMVMWNVGIAVQFVVTLILLARLHPALLALPVFGFPTVLAARWDATRTQRLETELAEPGRQGTHLLRLATDARSAAELKVFGMHSAIVRRRDEIFDEAQRSRRRLFSQALWRNGMSWLVFVLAFTAGLAFVVQRAANGRASAGDVLIAVALAGQVRGQLGSIVRAFNWMTQVVECSAHFLDMADMADSAAPQPDAVGFAPDAAPGLSLKGISFRYPGATGDVVKDISLHIPPGTFVAVVGLNGAGKSTLAKLLLGVYPPDTGAIELGRASAEPHPEFSSPAATAAFQDYLRPELSLREAVGIGCLTRLHDDSAVREALQEGGAGSLEDSLPEGLSTPIGTSSHPGAGLSGGQWQAIALARSFMRPDAALVVLDEPTAALDPLAEAAQLERWRARSRRNPAAITIVTTHRFGTARAADLILVVSDGRLAEAGPHDELLAAGGEYADLFRRQSRHYQ